MEALIRFPIERCRRRSSVGMAELIYATLLFGMTTMFMPLVTCGWSQAPRDLKSETPRDLTVPTDIVLSVPIPCR
jgi:hypothetical protein